MKTRVVESLLSIECGDLVRKVRHYIFVELNFFDRCHIT